VGKKDDKPMEDADPLSRVGGEHQGPGLFAGDKKVVLEPLNHDIHRRGVVIMKDHQTIAGQPHKEVFPVLPRLLWNPHKAGHG